VLTKILGSPKIIFKEHKIKVWLNPTEIFLGLVLSLSFDSLILSVVYFSDFINIEMPFAVDRFCKECSISWEEF
jgi:hypothetical protein